MPAFFASLTTYLAIQTVNYQLPTTRRRGRVGARPRHRRRREPARNEALARRVRLAAGGLRRGSAVLWAPRAALRDPERGGPGRRRRDAVPRPSDGRRLAVSVHLHAAGRPTVVRRSEADRG